MTKEGSIDKDLKTNTPLQLIEAKTFMERLQGLIGRKLPPNHGLLFRNSSSLHTFFMTYNIDIVFLDTKGQVVRIVKNLKPWRFCWCRAQHFFEVPSGRYTFFIGDTFELPLTHQ